MPILIDYFIVNILISFLLFFILMMIGILSPIHKFFLTLLKNQKKQAVQFILCTFALIIMFLVFLFAKNQNVFTFSSLERAFHYYYSGEKIRQKYKKGQYAFLSSSVLPLSSKDIFIHEDNRWRRVEKESFEFLFKSNYFYVCKVKGSSIGYIEIVPSASWIKIKDSLNSTFKNSTDDSVYTIVDNLDEDYELCLNEYCVNVLKQKK